MVMLKGIKQFFDKHFGEEPASGEDAEHALRLATAALLIEMMRMDYEVRDAERETVMAALGRKFDLSEDETAELLRLAEEEAGQATDYYQFTSLINQGFPLERKIKVVEHLWEVAYADGELNKYEEHMVRRIAELLYVPHKDFMAAKHRVLAEE